MFQICFPTFKLRLIVQNPGSRMGKKSRSGMKIQIWDEHPGSGHIFNYKFFWFTILKFFDQIRIRDLFNHGSETEKTGSGINIPDQHH
jgi:hypothetical protein